MKTRLKLWFAAALVAGAGVCTARAAMTHTAATLDTRAMVLAEILPESCTYATTPGDRVTLTVTFTADLAGVGPFVLPDNMGPIAFNVNGRTVTGRAGSNGGTSADGGAGSPVFRVGGGTTIAITGSSGSITGGAGGDGKKGGAGAYAFVNSSGEPFAVSDPGGLVRRGADGRTVLQNIPYRAWNEETRQMEDRVCTDYEVVTVGTKTFENGRWYVVRDPVARDTITVNGTAHLILCDGATLTVTGVDQSGILLDYGKSLTVCGQSGGSGTLEANGGTNSAGIGSGSRMSATAGELTVDGGIVLATGQGLAAGIGGSDNNLSTIGWKGYGNGGKVTINGGRVTATPGYGGSMGKPAAIGGGSNGTGGDVVIRGGTVNAIARSGTGIGMGTNRRDGRYTTLTVDGGSVKAQTAAGLAKNAAGAPLYCVTVKCPSFAKATEGKPLGLEGLDGYGTNDIYSIDGYVYLWLPDGTHRFKLSDGERTLRYCAIVNGRDVTVEPLGPVGFFVNGTDVNEGSGTGWTYGEGNVLSLNGEMTYVLSGQATNNEVQVKVAQQGATVVLSNAVVFTEGRPALDVTEGVRLLMTGGESYLVATNESAAITVAQNAEIKVDRESYANSREAMIGVFNFGDAATIDGAGSVSVNDGTFFVWGDNRAIGLPEFRVSGPELMKAGDAPEEMKYTTTDWASKKCVLVGPAVTVTVRPDIPHVTGFTVSNAVEVLQELPIGNFKVYRVMLGDDVFVGYTLEAGYVSRAANPLMYAAIEGDVMVDANTIPTLQSIPYRAWNEETRRMEDRVCTDYEVVTAGTQTFEDGKWYVVRDPVERGTITVNGAAHLILCDGVTLTATGVDQPGILLDYGKLLTVCGQSGGSGTLKANGGTNSAGIGSGSMMSATAGELTVDGGIVLATGQGLAAGIGGSDNNLSTIGWKGYGNGGKVTINGGRVTATPGYGGSMGKPAAIGGGSNGTGGDMVIRGGTVNAIARNGTGIGMGTNRRESKYATLTIDGGSVKAQTAAGLAKNAAGAPLYCVTVKCPSFAKDTEGNPLGLEGLGDYGTNDIFAVDGCVYLWLPDGTHRFALSDGEETLRYCAVVNGRDVTIEPLAAVGFLVNGTDVNEGSGTGWTYGEGNVLSLNAEMTYVLSGEATNNQVQVKVAQQGATVVLSNAVVFASGRPALDVAQTAALQMAGGESYLVSTNESAAVSVAEGVTLAVGLAPDANRLETAVGVFNFGAAAGIAGKGVVRVDGGTFCVWADVTGLETPNGVTCGADEIMMTGKTPEEARYATESGTEPCILVAPAVTVTVKAGIPHVTGFTVSNAVEEIQGFVKIADGTSYRVMLGDDVFVGYTLEAGYVSQAANPLVYAAIEGDVTIDANTIPTLQSIPYRAWNETTRQMEDRVCTNYTFVTADTEAFEDGRWYVVLDPVERGTIAVGGAAHLILCDGARLTAETISNGALAVYGQAENTGSLVVTGTVDAVLTVVGGNVKAESVTKQAKNAMGQDAYCVTCEGLGSLESLGGLEVAGLEEYGIEKAGLIDGRVYLWLPNGTHRFAISDGRTTRFYYAKVDGGNITVDPLEPLGFRVNGVDVFEGSGTGWSYDGDALTLDSAMTYVLSGAATNNEVQVKVTHQGATAVLSNAVVFASGRPAVVVAQGAALMTPVDEVMKAGETPETLMYATTCGAAPCVVAGPAVTVTVKAGIPHVTDFTVSNALEAIRGFTVVDGTAYRVMLGEDVFVGYSVEEWYYSHSANPLAYAAVGVDVTVDAESVRILPIIPYRAWNETTRQAEDRACTNYTVVAADTATFEDGRWYVVTNAVFCGTNAVAGAAHLILCDGARLTAEAITNGTLAVYGQPAGCGELVVSNDVASSLSVQGGRLSVGALSGDSLAIVGGTLAADVVGDGRTTIDGGSVKVGPTGFSRVKVGLTNFVNRAGQPLRCVTVKVPSFAEATEGKPLGLEGLGDYGTNDIYPIDGCVYLWLPNGTHRFTVSDGEKTLRYCAIVNGRDVTVEPLGSFGFFVNGMDVTEGSGTGWTYDVHGVLTLGAGLAQDTEMTYVLTGEATNDEVQVKVVQTDATVVVSNAVVFASGRPALVVERTVSLQMAGGASYFVSTNESAAISVEQNAEIRIRGLKGEDGLDPTVGVCNYGSAVAIAGGGIVRVDGGTFFVWADVTGLEAPNGVIAGADRVMKIGKTPETLRYAASSGTEPCILIAQAVTVTVKDGIPHASGFTVSNAVEEIGSMDVPDGKVYRAMTGDDIFIGYALEEGYVSPAANPLVYRAINGDVTVDANTIPAVLGIPYRAWNETTRQMEDRVCTNYTFVTADTATFEDGRWYVVRGLVSTTNLTVDGAAHLILCDISPERSESPSGDGCQGWARLTAETISNGTLAVYAQAENTGSLVVTGTVDAVLTVVGGNVKAESVTKQAKNAMGQDAYCVTAEGMRDEGRGMSVLGLEEYGIEKAGLIDGRVYLWLPNGTHRFALSDETTTNRYCAVVDGRGVTVEPLAPVGFFADGVDVGETGAGDGWHYQEKVLTLDGAKACVLSGEATNDEVQVNAAANGTTAVLSNAFVFTEGRPAVVIAQGAALAVAANQAMMAGENPGTLEYATTCGAARCVLAAPGAVITVKDIPHVSDVVVSNLTGTVPGVPIAGVPVSGGMVYRVLLNDNVFVGYTVEAGYVSPAENPLRYAVGSDITVDANTIPVVSDTVAYIDRWSGTNETVVVMGDYAFVDADLTTLASGVTYVVAGTVTNRHLLSLTGPATLVVCDGATLVAEGGFTSFYAPAETNALSVHGQAAGDGLLFAKDFRCVDVAIHGITTVTDGIFDGTPVILGGTVSANTVSNDQMMVVAGGSVWVENMRSVTFDGAERSVHSVICPVPGAVGRVKVEGLAGYCTEDIFPVDGRMCLYLPLGEHVFTVNGVRMRALVLGDGTVAERDVGGYLAYGRGGELLGAFDRLTNAVHAAADGGTVKLTNDCHEAGSFVLPEGAAVTLDGCGYQLTLDAADFDAPSALVSTNAALCLANLVLTRSAVSRRAGLLEIADGGALEMRDCAVTNCNAYGSPLISAANGGFRATGARFAGNTASALVQATVRSADARFAIANWSAVGNVCDELFSVGNLSGRVDACEIGAGEQGGNTCKVADLVVGVGAVCLRGAPPLPKVRLAGFAMSEDALHSHLVYRDAPPQDGVVVDVSSPDARIGSVIVSNAFNVAVVPQAVTLVTPGCRVAADAFGNLRLERAWAQPFIVRTVTGAQTNYASYASAEEAISRGGRDLLLMSYEEGGNCRSTLSGNVIVPVGAQLSLDTVRLTVTASENWTAPSPDPVTLDGDISVGTNGVLRLGNVIPGANHEIFVDHNASVMVEALPPQDRYLHFRFSRKVIDHVEDTGVVIGSTRLASDVLRKVCAVLNEGYELVPASEIPEGMSGALWLIPSKYYEAWIKDEETLRPSFIGAMESANGAVGGTNVTMYAISYTNETDGSVIGGYSSWGRGITVGGANGSVMLTVGSKRICVKGTGERTEVKSFFPPTQLDLGGSTLRILKDSVLKLEDVNVTGTFTLAGEGLLDLTDYLGPQLTVAVERASGVGLRPIARGSDSKIQLAPGQQGELFVKDGVVYWQLGVSCEYEQIDNGKLKVTILRNGTAVKTETVDVHDGQSDYRYTDPQSETLYPFTLYSVYLDPDPEKLYLRVPTDVSTYYKTTSGDFVEIKDKSPLPKDIQLNDAQAVVRFGSDAPRTVRLLDAETSKKVLPPDGSMVAVPVVVALTAGLLHAGILTALEMEDLAKDLWKKLPGVWDAILLAYTVIDTVRTIIQGSLELRRLKKYPLDYKGGFYEPFQFLEPHVLCQKDNVGSTTENLIYWRGTKQIGAMLLQPGLAILDTNFLSPGAALAQGALVDYTNKLNLTFDATSWVLLFISIIHDTAVYRLKHIGLTPISKAGYVLAGVGKAISIILSMVRLVYRYGSFHPPLNGSVTLSNGCDYDLMNMRFDGGKGGGERTAPVLVALAGSILELDTCELKNFKYSSPSGLVYVCNGATLILKDFTDFGNNTCTTDRKTPPIVAESGATVWLSGKTSIPRIQAVGADLRIGYGRHGKKDPQDRELTGSGEIKIVGETAFGTKIGTVWFQNATSKALDRIVSQSYSQWIKSAISEDGKSTVWKLTGNIPLSELEPIKFNKDAPFSISVSQSSSDRSATLTGGLAVPTQKARNAFPLEFSLISTDDLRKPFSDAGSVTVNAAGYFTNEVRNLQSTPTRHFRLKYKWRGAPDQVP